MPLLSNSILKNLKLIALDNVLSNSIDWYVEQAYRYYSHQYHTPLHIAKRVLNPAEVVLIYMEDECKDLSGEEILAIKEKLQNLPKPMLNIEEYHSDDNEELSDEEWVLQEIAKAEQINKKGGVKSAAKTNSMTEAMMQAQRAVEDLHKTLEKLNKPVQNTEGDIKFDLKDE